MSKKAIMLATLVSFVSTAQAGDLCNFSNGEIWAQEFNSKVLNEKKVPSSDFTYTFKEKGLVDVYMDIMDETAPNTYACTDNKITLGKKQYEIIDKNDKQMILLSKMSNGWTVYWYFSKK